ncbi:hypothetical protein [Desulfospira joergensenii]|uniref:hypothetical protein n=1 Tax=Desulfospira joergensenii TaxID=53329 RepID=UPI0003B6D11D|nr:hypothetical protein [Desulfospira joergensenii]
MSDFLRNLRSSHKKESAHPRKSMDGNYYPQNDRRIVKDRRAGFTGNSEGLSEKINEILPEIIEHIANLTEQVEKQTASNEKLAEANIRQADAVAGFFESLNNFLSSDLTVGASSAAPRPMATTSYASGTHYTKDDVLAMIRNMRTQGATFAIIADYLKEKGIPTFSGRGDWHAQTIHRLCK